MIGLFDSAGKRLSLTWQGYEFNGPFDGADTFDGGQQEGCFVDAVTMSTPINYQSEVQNELAKQGGGIEYYNPRIASRVLNIRARLQARDLAKLHEHLNQVQMLFSPMYLAYTYSGWPVPSGRPEWADPWTEVFQGLKFTGLTDASINTALASYAHTGLPLQYAVAPLTLPDPTVAAIGSGWGATIEMSWLILDGGIAMAQTLSTVSGTSGTATAGWSQQPNFPKLSFTTSGVPLTNLTVSLASSDPQIANATIVLDASSLTTGKEVDIIVRDREVFVDGVINNALVTSATWPMISPWYDTTILWTNTTNTTLHKVDWFEALSA
jgi:hypothetical protein